MAKMLSFAVEIGITKVVLEGDSLTIINALSTDHWSLSSFGPLIVLGCVSLNLIV